MPGSEHQETGWQMGLSNLSLPKQLLLFGGIQDTRNYLYQAGMQQGLEWTPATRTRLYGEIALQALVGNFQNEIDDWQLVGSMASSFSQRLNNINTIQRVGERVLMPPVRASLRPLRRMQQWVGRPLYTTLYTEELEPGETYNDHNAPFMRAQTISPDLADKSGYPTMAALVDGITNKGIRYLTVSPLHSVRPAQDHPEIYLEPWREWLPSLLRNGKIGQVAVSFGRSDLTPLKHSTAIGTSFDQMREILSGEPDDEHLGDLPAMLAMVRDMSDPKARPLVTMHVPAARIQETVPGIQPQRGHRILGEFIADQLGFSLPPVPSP